jgi:hypothetical protein
MGRWIAETTLCWREPSWAVRRRSKQALDAFPHRTWLLPPPGTIEASSSPAPNPNPDRLTQDGRGAVLNIECAGPGVGVVGT